MGESTYVHTVPWYSSGDGSDFPPRRSRVRRLKAAERKRAAKSASLVVPVAANGGQNGHITEPETSLEVVGHNEVVVESIQPKSWADLARGKQKARAQESPPKGSGAPEEEYLGTGNGVVVEADGGVRYPLARVLYGFDPKLSAQVYANRTVAVRGLINIGNICFMNSILQSLIHCTPFYALMKKIARESQFHIKSGTPILDGLIEFIDEFEREPPKIKSDEDEDEEDEDDDTTNDKKHELPSMSPDTFYSVISHHPKFKHLKRGRQEDAEEFLGCLLEALQEEFERAMAANPGMAKFEPTQQEFTESEDEWTQIGKGSKPVTARYSGKTGVSTPLNKIFSGQFKSVLERISPRTGAPSVTYDPFQHVQLDISDDSVHSIEDAFRMLSQPEQLTYQHKQTTIRAMKQVQFSALPGVLIVHLKRFTFNENGSQKITKPITFPYELEIPSQCLITAAQQRVYRLFAVVYHHGDSAHAGHYTVDVKSGNHWTIVDDIQTKKVELPWYASGRNDSSNEEERRTAYLLFYA